MQTQAVRVRIVYKGGTFTRVHDNGLIILQSSGVNPAHAKPHGKRSCASAK